MTENWSINDYNFDRGYRHKLDYKNSNRNRVIDELTIINEINGNYFICLSAHDLANTNRIVSKLHDRGIPGVRYFPSRYFDNTFLSIELTAFVPFGVAMLQALKELEPSISEIEAHISDRLGIELSQTSTAIFTGTATATGDGSTETQNPTRTQVLTATPKRSC